MSSWMPLKNDRVESSLHVIITFKNAAINGVYRYWDPGIIEYEDRRNAEEELKKSLPIVVVARRAGLRVHVGHIEGRRVPVEGGETRSACLATTQLTRRASVLRPRSTLARLQPVRQTDGTRALLGNANLILYSTIYMYSYMQSFILIRLG